MLRALATTSSSPLFKLPDDIVYEICTYLEAGELVALEGVRQKTFSLYMHPLFILSIRDRQIKL